jgi:hypothetical protein
MTSCKAAGVRSSRLAERRMGEGAEMSKNFKGTIDAD